MLKGIVTIITGGASGLGRGTAERFVREGASVVICDLPTSKGKEISEQLGDKAIFLPCDVSSEEQVEGLFQKCDERFGQINVLVNCAGIGMAKKIISVKNKEIHPLEDFIKVQKVNVYGTFNTMRYASKYFYRNCPDEDGETGVIVNTASIAAFDGQMGQVAYSASKGAIVGMTLPAARDLAAFGIRVATIAPGLFQTPILDSLPDDVQKFLVTQIPFPKRLGKPDEYAQLVQTIVLNKMCNGETFRLDGALRMQP